MLRQAVAVVLAAVGATLAEVTCPYTGPSFSTGYCMNDSTALCVVDSRCTEVASWTTASLVSSRGLVTTSASALLQIPDVSTLRFIGNGLKTVGDLSKAPNGSAITNCTNLVIAFNPGLQLDKMVLPASLLDLALPNNGLSTLPATVLWPARLTSIVLDNNMLQSYANGPVVETISLYNNSLVGLQNYDWRRMSYVNLDANAITSIKNVQFSATLTTFRCDRCELVEFTLDMSSFLALARAKSVAIGASNVKSCAGSGAVLNSISGVNNQSIAVCVSQEPFFNSSHASRGPIIWGSLAGLAVVIIGVYAFKRQCAQKSGSGHSYFKASDDGTAPSGVSDASMHERLDMTDLLPFRIDEAMLTKQRVLASGAFGQVFLGTYRGQAVAIKALLPHRTAIKDVCGLVAEAKLLSKLSSPYVVRFLGAVWSRPIDLWCVVEYMDLGDLRQLLATNVVLVESARLEMALAIAEGLLYLHSLDVIHRDLKSRNVLLDTAGHIKLTDFGVAREVSSNTMTAGVGTCRWVAPEVLQSGHYTTAADIYSFGVILSELDTRGLPYAELRNARGHALNDSVIATRVLQGTLTPSFSVDGPAWLRELGADCLSTDEDRRPTALQISTRLRQTQRDLLTA
ncbi:TKL/DRK protein kinase [Saprolegnia parasitica CBS 223.65]|uniref:TKL/DRK protein kinase n=1 Tax=Saprolegnia parasitica (strain CBS 223.65) TaxID=695850 RepID=A0A067DAV8_SAPPC|nr:TKL/DRK protein kinase [Saprolegnia parasitica CBS 223.65]KDO35751.1 TKL/DRK protein kinase [Saprolegnia parasitica CBS 223.65]|eukprot:XP_012193989.1 TKL/DRK protein kinase [Saprolegnia parasitica CBS 223.65]